MVLVVVIVVVVMLVHGSNGNCSGNRIGIARSSGIGVMVTV